MTDRYEYHSFTAITAKRSAWKPARKGYSWAVLYAVTFVLLCIFA